MKRITHFIIAGVTFLVWLICYILIHFNLNYQIFEGICLILISIALCLHLCLIKNTLNVIVAILYIPFIFAHPFDVYTIPIPLIVGGIVLGIGVIVNAIRFKPKLKLHRLFLSFCLICGALLLSGIGTSLIDYLKSLPMILIICLAFLALIIFFCSTVEKVNFEKIIFMLCIFSIFLQLQGYAAIFVSADAKFSLIKETMYKSRVFVGWGICNNLDLMLLFTLLAPLYYIFYFKFSVKSLILAPLCTTITFCSMTIFMSRGSLMVGLFGIVLAYIFFIIYFIYKKMPKKIIYFLSSTLGFIIIICIFTLAIKKYIDLPNYLKTYLSKIDFSKLNGRKAIYLKCLNDAKEHLIFGRGLLAGFVYRIDVAEGNYQWCHSTLLQSLYSAGLVGLVAMLIHLFFKYFYLLKNFSIEKLFLIMIMLLPGLYGLFDVSYFFINFMIVLIVILVLTQDLYDKKVVNN